MANVYCVKHNKTEAVLALKVLSSGLVEDINAVRRFFNEARLAATLRHPNTVRVFDIGNTEDGACYMAMEYLEGHTLGQALRFQSPLATERAVHIAKQILRSLGEAHGHKLVHRDLKPDNIFLIHHYGVPDFVKVLDFGIAKALLDTAASLTQTGTVVGTPRYMSPEQAQAHPVDPRSDLYSLGVILYELVTGRAPFEDEVPVQVLMQHINDPPVSVEVIRPELPGDLTKLIMNLLEKEPDDRPSDATAVLRSLGALDLPPWTGGDTPASPPIRPVQHDAPTNIFVSTGLTTDPESSGDPRDTDPTNKVEHTTQRGATPRRATTAPQAATPTVSLDTQPGAKTKHNSDTLVQPKAKSRRMAILQFLVLSVTVVALSVIVVMQATKTPAKGTDGDERDGQPDHIEMEDSSSPDAPSSIEKESAEPETTPPAIIEVKPTPPPIRSASEKKDITTTKAEQDTQSVPSKDTPDVQIQPPTKKKKRPRRKEKPLEWNL
tara:strand:- start:43 stop:1521 length:1479 start_codon:yes stop_codon:yes gene_type:complete